MGKIIGGISGLVGGGWFGASIGIAAFGTAIAGTIPLAIIGGVVGVLGGALIDR